MTIFLASVIILACVCCQSTSKDLVFIDGNHFGVVITQNVQTGGPDVTVGYKSVSFAKVPALRPDGTSVTATRDEPKTRREEGKAQKEETGEETEAAKSSTGEKGVQSATDGLSVFASFSTSSIWTTGFALGRLFATGVAAQELGDEFNKIVYAVRGEASKEQAKEGEANEKWRKAEETE